MTRWVRDAERCEHETISAGRRCKQRGFVLISRGDGQPKWSCGTHYRMVRRESGDEVFAVAVREGNAGRWWQGPELAWP